MGELARLPNIGSVLESQLHQVGIISYDQLKSTGSKQVWLKIKGIDPSACIHRLYALEGAIQEIRKSKLTVEEKAELKAFYDDFKG